MIAPFLPLAPMLTDTDRNRTHPVTTRAARRTSRGAPAAAPSLFPSSRFVPARLAPRLVAPCLVALTLAGCGVGTAAVASGADGGSESGANDVNQPPAIEIALSERELTPARVTVRVIDLDAPSPIDVELLYAVDGGEFEAMTLVPAPGGDALDGLTGDASGVDHVYAWDFEADLGSAALEPELQIRVQSGELFDQAPEYVGNDQPQPVITKQTGEGGQITVVFNPVEELLAQLADQVEDVEVNQEVFIKPEVRVDGVWLPADPVPDSGTVGLELTLGDDGFVAVVSAETGEPTESPFPLWTTNAPLSAFPWDTEQLLADRSGFFEFRLTVKDEFTQPGDVLPTATAQIFVDNAALATTIDAEALVAGGDRRGAISIPFQFTNVSNGPVRFLLQAAEDGVFPPLPDPGVGSGGDGNGGGLDEQLDQILGDPALRAEFGLMDQRPFEATVDVTLLGEVDRLRCADLRGEASWFARVPRVGGAFAPTLAGSRLRVLRGADRLRPADTDWPGGGASGLLDLELLGDGERAVVLTEEGGSGLAIVELATGAQLVHTGAALTGTLLGLDVGPDGRSVFAVVDSAGGWTVRRVELPEPGATEWAAPAVEWVTGEGGDFRAVEALGRTTVAIAAVDRLVTSHLDPATGAVRSGPLLAGVSRIRDLELDRRDPRRLLLAVGSSGGASGYLGAVDLDTGRLMRRPLPEIGDPRSLAQSADGRSLFVIDAAGGTRLLDVGYRHGRFQSDPIVLEEGLAADAHRVRAAGGRSRVVLTEASGPRLQAAGGVLVERAIAQYDAEVGELVLAEPLPQALVALPAGTPRRARLESPRPETPVWLPPGRSNLRWDAERRWPKGPVTLRIVPFSSEVQGDAAEVSFDLTSDFDDLPDINVFEQNNTFLGNPVAMEPAEFDGDGRPDVVYIRSASQTVDAQRFVIRQFFQTQDPAQMGASVADGGLALLDVDQDGSDEILYGGNGDDGGGDGSGGPVGDLRVIDWLPTLEMVVVDALTLPATSGSRHLAVADVDRDGLDDVLAFDPLSGRVDVFLGATARADETAFPALPSHTVFTATTTDDDRAALVVADFDTDGDQDLVVAAGTAFEFLAGEVDPQGNWDTTLGVVCDLASIGAVVDGRAIDADADGRADLALSFAGGGERLRLYRFDELTGRLEDHGAIGDGPETPTVGHLAVADVDRDGASDLATGSFGPVTGVEVFRSPGALPEEAALAAGKGPIAAPVTEHPVAFAFADWVGNGSADLFTGAYYPGAQTTFALTVQAGPGDYREGEVVDLGQQLRFDRLTFADLDGDLLLDAVGVPPNDESVVHVYLQDAPGRFAAVPSQVLQAPPQGSSGGLAVREPRRIEVADFDGDGLQDVLALTTARYDGYIEPGAHDCTEPFEVDFLASEVEESTFVLWRGRPDGTLEPLGDPFGFQVVGGDEVAHGSFATGAEPHGNAVRDMAVGDVNGDGRPDLRVAHSRPYPVADCNGAQLWYIAFQHLSLPRDVGELYEGAVYTYLNNGTSTPFSDAPEETQPFTSMTTFRFADGDGDGLLDVLRFPISIYNSFFDGPALFAHLVQWDAVELLPAEGPPPGSVPLSIDSGNTLLEFDANILVEDWTLDGAPDLLVAGEGIEISGEDSRLWVLDNQAWMAGQDDWQALSFYSPVSTKLPQKSIEMKYVVPTSVEDVDFDGLPDLAARFVGGNQGLAFTGEGADYPVDSGLLMRRRPTFGDIEPVWLSTNPEWLALPSIATLERPRFIDLDQDGTFELWGITDQPGGATTLWSRPVVVFSDR